VLLANARYGLDTGQALLLAQLGRLDAAALTPGAPRYDATDNLRRQKAAQVGPFVPIVRAFDQLQVSSGHSRPAPVPAIGPDVRFAPASPAAPSDGGALARGLPFPADGRSDR